MHNLRVSLVTASAAGFCLLTALPSASQITYPKQFVTPQPLSSISANNDNVIGVGDLNGDGRPDILYPSGEEISTGKGTFRFVAQTYNFPTGSKLIDVNGDGKLDVVAPIQGSGFCGTYPDGTPYCEIDSYAAINIYLGNGDGTFRGGFTLNLQQYNAIGAVATVGDFNGDGKPDIAVGLFNSINGASASGLILINDGTGKFSTTSTTLPSSVAGAGDFNGDGKIDLVLEGQPLQILFGNGDGTFTAGPQSASGVDPTSVAIADFNHDGKLDIATNSASGVEVFWGHGDGTFTPKLVSTIKAGFLQAADLNHDGYPDLIGVPPIAGNANDSPSTSLSVFTNQRNGTFSNPKTFEGSSFTFQSFAVSDFNGDGYLDVAAGNAIYYGTYGASFLTPILTSAPYTDSVAVGDFNRDGTEDVVAFNYSSDSITIYPGSGQGYLNAGASYSAPVSGGASVTVGDVNGDGIADIVVAAPYPAPAGSKNVAVFLGNGDGTFKSSIKSSVGAQPTVESKNQKFYVVDVNHDGKADLVGDWGVALGNGDGTFATAAPFSLASTGIDALAVADINGDGAPDVVIGNAKSATIYTLINNGHGAFTVSHQEKLDYANAFLTALTLADMDGDGKPDLVYSYFASPTSGAYGRVVVEKNDGSGSFSDPTGVRFLANSAFYATLLIDDFNRDGKPDVAVLTVSGAVSGPTAGASILILGTGGGALSPAQYFQAQMYSGAIIDLNGDQAPDIVGPSVDASGIERILNTGATQ